MTGNLSRSEREFIRDLATAVKWRIEADVEAGSTFEVAKAARIQEAEASWKGLLPDMRQSARFVCENISLADLSPRTHRAMNHRVRRMIEERKGKPLGWFDRLLWRWFGVVWTV